MVEIDITLASVEVELREADDGAQLHATILQEGRAAAGGRAEVFAPDAASWPSEGIAIRTRHHGPEVARAVPERDGTLIRIAAPATAEIRAAFEEGKRRMSVEFFALDAVRTPGGVREVRRALLSGAAMTSSAEYEQTEAEIRSRDVRRYLL
ncbi:MAG: hypothetical protein F4Y57_08965 [Acidobacteria bacterium]|nr:hypothetical protein [Acidobacteriota bacterium]